MSEIQIALEYRMRQLEAVLRQAREALNGMQKAYREAVKLYDPNHDDAYTVKSHNALAAIDAALSGAPKRELSDERIFEMIKADFGLPDVGTQKKLYAFARAVIKEAGK